MIDADAPLADEAPARGNMLLRRAQSVGTSEPTLSTLTDEPGASEPAPSGEQAAADEEPAVPEKSLEQARTDFQAAFSAFWLGRGQAPPRVGATWWRNDVAAFTWAIWLAVQVRVLASLGADMGGLNSMCCELCHFWSCRPLSRTHSSRPPRNTAPWRL